MGAGLVSGYGAFGAIAARYLYPARPDRTRWMFVAATSTLHPGDAMTYHTPAGAGVTIARRADGGTVDDFIAMSTTCPHLGCQVHWEGRTSHFRCPCHNGIFDADGRGVSGPPGEAGQSLPRYPLQVEHGLLFIEVPTDPIPTPTPGPAQSV